MLGEPAAPAQGVSPGAWCLERAAGRVPRPGSAASASRRGGAGLTGRGRGLASSRMKRGGAQRAERGRGCLLWAGGMGRSFATEGAGTSTQERRPEAGGGGA